MLLQAADAATLTSDGIILSLVMLALGLAGAGINGVRSLLSNSLKNLGTKQALKTAVDSEGYAYFQPLTAETFGYNSTSELGLEGVFWTWDSMSTAQINYLVRNPLNQNPINFFRIGAKLSQMAKANGATALRLQATQVRANSDLAVTLTRFGFQPSSPIVNGRLEFTFYKFFGN